MGVFWSSVKQGYIERRAAQRRPEPKPTVRTHSKAPARSLTEGDVDGWFAAVDARKPEAIIQLEQFINQLAEESPRWRIAKTSLTLVLKQADKRGIRWNRG